MNLKQAAEHFYTRPTTKSRHTLDAYEITLRRFFEFLNDPEWPNKLPFQAGYKTAEEIPVSVLGQQDAPVIKDFAIWLLADGNSHNTALQRCDILSAWLTYLDDYGWLPEVFPLRKARRILADEIKRPASTRAPEPNPYIGEVIRYYDELEMPERLKSPAVQAKTLHRWAIEKMRNSALIHCLAETGGRISEVLSLNVDDFPSRYLQENQVLRVQVKGKGNYTYDLRFYDSLPYIRRYVEHRGSPLTGPLFVAHRPPHTGNRITRVTAWRIVAGAAKALGIGKVSPHDFRHWRATQLVNAGQPLDVVQDYLGHRYIETTRQFYASTDARRVDDAVLDVPVLGNRNA